MNKPSMPTSFGIRRSLWMGLLCLGLFLASAGAVHAQDAYHHLIAGSFDEFSAANDMMASLKAKGQAPVLLLPAQGSDNYRVSVYQSSSRPEVQAYQTNLKKQGSGKGYWILSLNIGSETAATETAQAPANRRMRNGELPSDGTGNTYHLIVGSFDSFGAADQAVVAMEGEGYEPYVLLPNKSSERYRISVYRSMDREEIEDYNKLLRKRGKKSGWIYQEEPGTSTTFNQPTVSSQNARLTPGNPSSANQNGATYHLIAGSFDRFDQASNFADAMRNQGYNPLIMFPETGISQTFRVSVYQSTMKDRVSRFQQQLSQQGTNGWIYAQQ